MPCLTFISKEDAQWPKEFVDADSAAIRNLRARLRKRCAGYFAEANELAVEVLAALRVLEATRYAKQIEAVDVIQKGQELGPSYLMNIKEKLITLRDTALIEFQIGSTPWWNTRLHLIAAVAQDFGRTREFVFVDRTRHFLAMAPPAEIRRRLERRWPRLRRAYARFRKDVSTLEAIEEILWRYPMAVEEVFGKDEQSAKQVLEAVDLKAGLGIAHDAEVVDIAEKGQVALQRAILDRPTPFAALVRHGVLEGLVDRQELAAKVAQRALAQFP